MEQGLRYEFGRNWESFSNLLDESRIAEAERRLSSILESADLSRLSFLDVGCGSGVHALAALKLGAAEVTALDIDPLSVRTTERVLERSGRGSWRVIEADVLHADHSWLGGPFDIVYSWGVLHHTGNMRQAILNAARQVKPGGHFALALYGKTRYCGIWTSIKRWYVSAKPAQRTRAEAIYIHAFSAYLRLRGKRLKDHIASYQRKRGMDFYHDVRDWLGGYPYESIRPRELRRLLEPLGFELLKQKVKRRSGLFGSGNDEYLFRLRS